jgi:RNA polymerase sigma factor (sigma-70 family)
VEASALHRGTGIAGAPVRSPLLRLRSDEQLIVATRRGNQAAFETLVQRYQARLLAFCRHMLGSKEDAEDVLQEVFAAAYNAMLADDRPINTRPWLYRIARNRSLNHLRKPRSNGQDSMDIFERDNGSTTADTVHQREEFRQIVTDVSQLPETQRSALLLREIDALSYDQIAETMDTTVPSVKSLLVRARVSLAEASEARLLTCAEVRLELGEVAEGLTKTSAPVRRHLKECKRCRTFRDELKNTSKALAAIYPIGPIALLQQLGLAKLFGGGAAASTAGGAGSAGSVAGTAGLVASGAASAGGGMSATGAISAGIGTLTGKAAAGMAAAAIVTAGAVEVKQVSHDRPIAPSAAAVSVRPPPAAIEKAVESEPVAKVEAAPVAEPVAVDPVVAAPVEPSPIPVTPAPAAGTIQEEEGTVTLPDDTAVEPVPDQTDTNATPPPAPPPPTGTTPAPPPAAPPTAAPPASGQTTAPPPPPPPPAP